MKNISLSILLAILSLTSLFISCVKEPDTETALSVYSQIAVLNSVYISNVAHPRNAWIVLRKDISGDPEMTDIISKPVSLTGGKYSAAVMALDTADHIASGDFLWVMLHEDTGVSGVFEYEGSGSEDQPVYLNSVIAGLRFYVKAPYLKINDQAVINGRINVDTVSIGTYGWIKIFHQNQYGDIGQEIGSLAIDPGQHDNYQITFDNSETPASGSQLIGVLYIDQTTVGEFDEEMDYPEIFGKQYIFSNFIISGD